MLTIYSYFRHSSCVYIGLLLYSPRRLIAAAMVLSGDGHSTGSQAKIPLAPESATFERWPKCWLIARPTVYKTEAPVFCTKGPRCLNISAALAIRPMVCQRCSNPVVKVTACVRSTHDLLDPISNFHQGKAAMLHGGECFYYRWMVYILGSQPNLRVVGSPNRATYQRRRIRHIFCILILPYNTNFTERKKERKKGPMLTVKRRYKAKQTILKAQ